MEAGQDLDHQKLTSGLGNAFLTGSLDEAANYAFHGPILKLLTFIEQALRSSEESKHGSMYRGSEKTAYGGKPAPENAENEQLIFHYSSDGERIPSESLWLV